MASQPVNGIAIEIEAHGRAEAPAFVLVRGLGTQLVQWPRELIDPLIAAGCRVVLFDNRDVGLSQKFDAAGPRAVEPAYRVADMADDVVGVLDALDISRAHVAGISMGGMIVQHVAATHGDRCRSMTSIMSSSGAPGLPQGTPEAMAALTSRPSDPDDRACVIAHSRETQRTIGSPAYPMTDAELRRYCERAYDRCYCPDGVARQMAAVLTDAGRAELLAGIRVPSLVIHGVDDPLVPIAAGEDTARRIPGCRLERIEGMGHDVTAANAPILARLLVEHAVSAAGP